MPVQKRGVYNHGEGAEDSENRNHRRGRRKRPPVRFADAAIQRPPSAYQEQHALQLELPNPVEQQIQESPPADLDCDDSGTDPEEFDEIVTISLSELRNNVQCPICLGILKKTRTVMGCLHRFCGECIDKSMRLGNNECPACRMHCASRRSLRADQNFDTFVSSIYPDVENYEKEELILLEEERTRNEQIQASIAQISLRQSEALVKVRKTGKDTASASALRGPRNCSNSYSRRRNGLRVRFADSNENQNEIDLNSNALIDEHQPKVSQSRRGIRAGVPPIRSPLIIELEDGDDVQHTAEPTSEIVRSSPVPLKPEMPTWGRGGIRSHTRHGGASSSKAYQTNRIQKLTDHLASLEKNVNEHAAPVVTSLVQLDEMLWVKDLRTFDPNPSGSMDVLKSPPEEVKKFSDFKSIAFPPWTLDSNQRKTSL